jgi:hypothetical protein
MADAGEITLCESPDQNEETVEKDNLSPENILGKITESFGKVVGGAFQGEKNVVLLLACVLNSLYCLFDLTLYFSVSFKFYSNSVEGSFVFISLLYRLSKL